MARTRLGAATAILSLTVGGAALVAAPQAAASDWTQCLNGSSDRQAVFARAGSVSGVPERVLLAVSYLESRWDSHGGKVSTSGGYGPMHLTSTDLKRYDAPEKSLKGEEKSSSNARVGTLQLASDLTGVDARTLRTDEVANICGGAAVLASYQPGTSAQNAAAWSKAIGRYAGAADEPTALRFTRQVFDVLRSGEARTTDDGDRVVLQKSPHASLNTSAVRSASDLEPGLDKADCPRSLACEVVEAPYEQYGDTPGAYGNHDLADRPHDLGIDYIVIHNTEGSYETALDLVQDPTYVSWQYTLRSSDGHVAQHVDNRQVAWHAGNWYVNTHAIGIEHEGYAAQGATWFTEAMYRSSAKLVRHLAHEYDIPLDRAHVIGHDQVPGITPAYVKGMHWDTGPFWDWEHYFDLLGAPIDGDHGHHGKGHHGKSGHHGKGHHAKRGHHGNGHHGSPSVGDLVTVAPGFDRNEQPVTGCGDEAGVPCEEQGTNFSYLHTEPDADSPLVKDVGLHPDGTSSTTEVWDIGARAAAGHQFRVADRQGSWLGVWWLGDVAWLHAPHGRGVEKTHGKVVVPDGSTEVPVYGRAYPEESAYAGTEIPYQTVTPLQYTIKPGQSYVLADKSLSTDYYYAKTFDDSLPDDHTVVEGDDVYYQIWFGHRIAYVRAADVDIRR